LQKREEGQRHNWPYGAGPRSRGRGRGRGHALVPLPPRSGHHERSAGGDNDLLLNVQAGVLLVWLRPCMPALDTDSEADDADKPRAPAAAAAGQPPTPPPVDIAPPVEFADLPARLDTPDLPDDINDPMPVILGVELASGASIPSPALQTLVDLALEDAQPPSDRVDYATQDATYAGGTSAIPLPSAASLPLPLEPWVSVPVVTSSTSLANASVLATSASMPPTKARASIPTDMSPAAIATAALAAFFAPYLQETAPLPEVRSQPTEAAAPADTRGVDEILSSWLEQQGAEHYQMSASSGELSAFEPVPYTSASYSALHVSVRPTLQARDVVNVACSTFGVEEAQLLVPSILCNFETQLTSIELAERLQWLWLMRREIASQVRDVIFACAVSVQKLFCASC